MMHTIYIYTMNSHGGWTLTDGTRSIEEATAIIRAALYRGEQLMILNDSPTGENKWAPPPLVAA